MAKLNISTRLASGVKRTVRSEYKTSDGRAWANAKLANHYQTILNREAAVKEVLRGAGLMAYKSSDHILSLGPLASYIANGTLLAKLTAAATGRQPRHTATA